jgi:uncharacterized YccA/Bax inhibitor family protein
VGGLAADSAERMTLSGTLHRTAILLVLFAASAVCSWIEVGLFQHGGKGATLVLALVFSVCAISGVVLVWTTVFIKTWSPVTGPIYAMMQGVVVGFLSVGMDRRFPGVVIQAVGLTIAICICLLVAYRFGFIRVTESFNKKLAAATSGVIVYYLACFGLALMGGRTLSKVTGGIPGILISVIIVAIAGMSLVSNFDFAAQCSKERFPKYMEWYAALGLLVTLIWLYVETLKLLSKARNSQG